VSEQASSLPKALFFIFTAFKQKITGIDQYRHPVHYYSPEIQKGTEAPFLVAVPLWH